MPDDVKGCLVFVIAFIFALIFGLGTKNVLWGFFGFALPYGFWVLIEYTHKKEEEKRERLEKQREEEEARLQREAEDRWERVQVEQRNRIEKLAAITNTIMKRAISKATESKESLWLSALLVLQENLQIIYDDYTENREYYDLTVKKILEIKRQVEVLSSEPSSEESKSEKPEDNFDQTNYYQLLGIKKDATTDQIISIYRSLVKIYHPDVGKSFGIDGDQRFRKIQEAYETLVDTTKRRDYDRKIGG